MKKVLAMEWFSQNTRIGETEIPNWAIVLLAVIVTYVFYSVIR